MDETLNARDFAADILQITGHVLDTCFYVASFDSRNTSTDVSHKLNDILRGEKLALDASSLRASNLGADIRTCLESAIHITSLCSERPQHRLQSWSLLSGHKESRRRQADLVLQRQHLSKQRAQIINFVKRAQSLDLQYELQFATGHDVFPGATNFSQEQPMLQDHRREPSIRDSGMSNWHEESMAQYAAITEHPMSSGPWASKRVLCLDGTNLRGMVSLFVLEYLMELVAAEERTIKPAADSSADSPLYLSRKSQEEPFYRFRPCHYFDYICGTGLGGMSAVLLGSMRFSVRETIERNENTLYAIPKLYRLHMPTGRLLSQRSKISRYLIGTLQDQLEQTPGSDDGDIRRDEYSLDLHPAILEADEEKCQSIAITAMKAHRGLSIPYIMRSYPLSDTTSSSSPELALIDKASRQTWRTPIVNACLATIAPPLYSNRLKIEGFPSTLRNARTIDVNPAWVAYGEIKARLGDPRPDIDCFIAIRCTKIRPRPGDAKSDASQYDKRLDGLLNGSLYLFKDDAEPLGGYENRTDLDLDDPKDFGKLREEAQAFCEKNDVKLKECARNLVEARRRRAKTAEWSKFAGLKSSRGARF